MVWLPSLERCPDLAQSRRYSVHLKDFGRLAGPLRGQARSHRGLCASLRNWSAGRPPLRAGWLLQILSTSERFRSADRPPSRASSLPQVLSTSERFRSAGRPPSRASSLPQKSKKQSIPHHRVASHHSSGRALARLQLLILIHPPPRQAEWRCSSGDGRAAPFDAVELIAGRCSEANRRAMPPDEYRSEGTPSLGEGPYVRGETFWFLLCRLTKGTRRKGGTISRRYRKNGYVLNQPRTWSTSTPPMVPGIASSRIW